MGKTHPSGLSMAESHENAGLTREGLGRLPMAVGETELFEAPLSLPDAWVSG